jgi:hypothetical protein
VDLWDLTKLLFRRWYFALPLLILSLGAVVAASQTVKPDYDAQGQLQMIPPVGGVSNGPHNPWIDLGYSALGQAVVIKISNDAQVRTDLAAAGLSDNFTVNLEYGTTYITTDAIGSSPAQATASVQRILQLLDDEVRNQQKKFGVLPSDSVTTSVLNPGDKVTEVTSKVKRVIIVAAGIGLLVSTAMTIALDAILRRRSRRRSEAASSAVMDRDPIRPTGSSGTARGSASEAPTSTMSIPTSPAIAPTMGQPVAAGQKGVPAPRSFRAADEQRQPAGNSVSVEYRSRGTDGRPAETRTPDEDLTNTDVTMAPVDSTIILPLSHTPWGGRDDRRR